MYLEFTWHYELWSVYTDEGVHAAEEKNGQDDRKVTDELPHLEGGNIRAGLTKVFYASPCVDMRYSTCISLQLFDKELNPVKRLFVDKH